MYISLRDRDAVFDPIARMQNHLVTRRQTGKHLGNSIIAVPGLYRCGPRATIPDREDRPIGAAPEQCGGRHNDHVGSAPDRNVHIHPIVMAQPRPDCRWVNQFNDRTYALLLNPEGGDLREPGW